MSTVWMRKGATIWILKVTNGKFWIVEKAHSKSHKQPAITIFENPEKYSSWGKTTPS